MKLTKLKLKQIIREELNKLLLEREGETPEDVANRIRKIPGVMHQTSWSPVNDLHNMAQGDTSMASEYPHIDDLQTFAREVLALLGTQVEETEETYEQLPSVYGRRSRGAGGYGNPISAKQAVWAIKRGSIK